MLFATQYAFAILCGLYGIVWAVLFYARKNLRTEMLLMSLFTIPLGPLSEFFYTYDYWKPQYLFSSFGFEDILWAFFIGGIAGIIYEAVFGKKLMRIVVPHKRLLFLLLVPVGLAIMYFGVFVFKLNSLYVSSALFLAIGLLVICFRPDLIPNAFFTAFFTAGLLFFIYEIWFIGYPGIIEKWWFLKNLSGVLIFGVPPEELLWGFSWGFVAGPFFEFVAGSRYVKNVSGLGV